MPARIIKTRTIRRIEIEFRHIREPIGPLLPIMRMSSTSTGFENTFIQRSKQRLSTHAESWIVAVEPDAVSISGSVRLLADQFGEGARDTAFKGHDLFGPGFRGEAGVFYGCLSSRSRAFIARFGFDIGA